MEEIKFEEYLLNTDNTEFVKGEATQPLNIEEIRQNLLIQLYEEGFENPLYRFGKGLLWLGCMVIVTYVGSVATLKFFMDSNWLFFLMLLIVMPPSILMGGRYTWIYLSPKSKQTTKFLEEMFTKRELILGKILSQRTYGKGLKVYFTFYSPKQRSEIGVYYFKQNIIVKNKERVVVCYHDGVSILL